MAWPKGKSRKGIGCVGKGRPPGIKNKLSRDIVQKIIDINANLEKEKKGLADCAKQDPKWFHQIFTRAVVPKDVNVAIDGDLKISWQD